MTQPLINNRVYNQTLYSSALDSLWSHFQEVYPISYALHEDIDAWEVCLRNGAFYQGTQQRLHEVVGDEWHCYPSNNSKDPEDIMAARVTEDAIRCIVGFFDALKRQAQSIFRGWSAQLVTGKRRWCRLGGVWANWWVPTKIEHVDIRRFRVMARRDKDARGRERVKGELWISPIPQSLASGSGSSREHPSALGYVKVEHPEHFFVTVYDDEESRLGQGRGIMDTLYFYVWADQIVMKEGLQGLERWSQGLPVGYVDAEAKGDTGQDSETERNEMETQLHRMKSRGVFVTDKRNKIEVLTGGAEGHQIVSGWRDYIDGKIIGVSTGAILASGTGADTGSFARDKEGANVQGRVVQFDRNKISEDVNEGPLTLFWSLNRPQLAEAGLIGAARPDFRIISRRVFDPSEAVTRVKLAREAGIDLPEDEVYEQIAFSQPKQGQKVLKGFPPPSQAPNPFMQIPGLDGTPEQQQPERVSTPEKPASPAQKGPIRPAQKVMPAKPKLTPPTSEDVRARIDQARHTAGVLSDLAVIHSYVEQAEEAARQGDLVPVRSAMGHADNRLENSRRRIPGDLSLAIERAFVKAWESISEDDPEKAEIHLGELRSAVASAFDSVSAEGGGLLAASEARARSRETSARHDLKARVRMKAKDQALLDILDAMERAAPDDRESSE